MRPPEFWTRSDGVARLVRALLAPIGWLYGASVQWKARQAHPYQFSGVVICVGNLTAGGTGKTPVAMTIARLALARGLKTAFLTRGYGGKVKGPAFVMAEDRAQHVGDEPLLLASVAPVIVARDRGEGAKLAEENGFDVLVMDDGHQNFSLHKNLSLVVVDAETGFGNGLTLPAGPLREPVSQGLSRADAVIIVGDGTPDALTLTDKPIVRTQLETDGREVHGRSVVAFAGIGRPEKFFDSLTSAGARIVEARPYADHYVYSQSDIARLKARARAENALLVTTEKDYVRLTPAEREGIVALPVVATFGEDSGMARLLDSALRRGVPPQAT
ncbi:MAG TPA: tetraacyldisaccharide 4'-kinase [Rhizomicrobium sp.]|nr:tetraacyldisaccharide 4'-kinase [Rhizomicrobium sp.]